MEIQEYNITLNYHPGEDMLLVDGQLKLQNKNNPIDIDIRVEFAQFSSVKLTEVKKNHPEMTKSYQP